MPPRIPSSRLPQPPTCQCFRTRPNTQLPKDGHFSSHPSSSTSSQTRQFHASPHHERRQRRMPFTEESWKMHQWLQTGPGRNFRYPLEGSTNYLGAYSAEGEFTRSRGKEVMRAARMRPNSQYKYLSPAELRQEESAIQKEKQRGASLEEMHENAAERTKMRAQEAEQQNPTPPERHSDMKPYPLNENFRAQSVLSEELREQIYHQVVVVGLGLDTVASSFGVDMRRVAAVVRLMTIEKQWAIDNKPMAKPYAKAVLGMLSKTPYQPNNIVPHETINDLPVHPSTRNQIFYPTSESRVFTREDAASAFSAGLLPADERIPLPVLVKLEKWNLENLPREERQRRLREDDLAEQKAQLAKQEKKAAWEARTQRVVPGRRWDFKFQDISAEKVGPDGRGKHAVGYRYGVPQNDRSRGLVKIPQSVE